MAFIFFIDAELTVFAITVIAIDIAVHIIIDTIIADRFSIWDDYTEIACFFASAEGIIAIDSSITIIVDIVGAIFGFTAINIGAFE